MATFTWTYLPILTVLQNGGSMNLKELSEKLNSASQRHFQDMSRVEFALKNYVECLKVVEGDRVVYDRNAKKYAKIFIMERDVAHLLHEHIPNMSSFQLYPYTTPQNSPTCPVGVPWKDVPRDEESARARQDPYTQCDFRCEGEDSCRLGCGVKEQVLRKLGLLS